MSRIERLTCSEGRLGSTKLVNQDESPSDHVMILLPKLGHQTMSNEVIYAANRLIQLPGERKKSRE